MTGWSIELVLLLATVIAVIYALIGGLEAITWALHLLRILPADEMRAILVATSEITNKQVGLFESQ